ncbi:MAG: hypothetical protein J0H17_03955 [Rhizobiales bacterium]|nr:hypothetical protein [Hyphomicrobiales bacterium]
MIPFTSEQKAALANRHVMRRFFLWCEARDPVTGDPDPAGFWDDVGDVIVESKTYHGSGGVISIGTVVSKGDMTIPGMQITLSGLDPDTKAMIRGSRLAQAPITVKLGIFDPATRDIIGPLIPYFVGIVDDATVSTPAQGGDSAVVFTCESTSRALTRAETATRSPASCRERDPDDAFYDDTSAQATKPVYWGRKEPATKKQYGTAS